MVKYIHIGYPKNMSTALQRDFFDKHPDIYHLGIGCGSNIGYINRQIQIAVEMYLVYCRDMKYFEKENTIKNAFNNCFESAKSFNAKAVGISCELFSFGVTPDNIDITTKANRLFRIFGNDTKIIMIIRDQFDLLKSMYLEFVRIGYQYSFQEYINYVYKYQDRSFLFDFLYDKTYSLYANLFGNENILILPIESIRDENSKKLLQEEGKLKVFKILCNYLEIPYLDTELGHFNQPLTNMAITKKLELNSLFPHDLGNNLFKPANTHRLLPYFEDELKIAPPEDVFNNVLLKRQLIKQAQENEIQKDIDFYIPDIIYNRLSELFRQSNRSLNSIVNIEEYNYVL